MHGGPQRPGDSLPPRILKSCMQTLKPAALAVHDCHAHSRHCTTSPCPNSAVLMARLRLGPTALRNNTLLSGSLSEYIGGTFSGRKQVQYPQSGMQIECLSEQPICWGGMHPCWVAEASHEQSNLAGLQTGLLWAPEVLKPAAVGSQWTNKLHCMTTCSLDGSTENISCGPQD